MQDSGTKKVIGGVKEISSGNLISGAKDIATGQFERKYSVLVKGVAVPLSRVADAVYSPLSAFIGSALNDSGVGRNVGKIVNNAGEVVADKSGIVDKEKFKLYIAENGEYVEDFLRILDVVSELTGTAAFSTVVKSSAKKEVFTFKH
jgi:hypothetical protein